MRSVFNAALRGSLTRRCGRQFVRDAARTESVNKALCDIKIGNRGASVTRRETSVTTRDLESIALSVAGRSPRLSHRKRLICKQACDEPFSSATRVVSLVSRRKWDLNPCSAINALLPFQGSPFSLLGISPKNLNHPVTGSYKIILAIYENDHLYTGGHFLAKPNGECGIRTHGPLRDHWFSRPAPSTTRPTLQKHTKSARRGSNPRSSPWQGDVLPLYHSRIIVLVSQARVISYTIFFVLSTLFCKISKTFL